MSQIFSAFLWTVADLHVFFFPSLADSVYLLPAVWFPRAVWKLSPSFYYCPSEQHPMSCGHPPAGAAGTDLRWAGVFIALSCNSWTPVWCKTLKDLWKMGLLVSLYGKMPLVSDYFFSKTSFSFWWEMLKQRIWVSVVEFVFQWGFSFAPEHPY